MTLTTMIWKKAYLSYAMWSRHGQECLTSLATCLSLSKAMWVGMLLPGMVWWVSGCASKSVHPSLPSPVLSSSMTYICTNTSYTSFKQRDTSTMHIRPLKGTVHKYCYELVSTSKVFKCYYFINSFSSFFMYCTRSFMRRRWRTTWTT